MDGWRRRTSVCGWILTTRFDAVRQVSARGVRAGYRWTRIRVSFFGRLVEEQKGYLSFLDAVRDLPSSTGDGRAISFHVWGKGESVDESAYPLVQFHGHVTDAELVNAFASSDVIVMPSRYEPFGYVALEALASGCILIATTGQGMDEFLVPDKNFVARTSDSTSVENELEKVLERPERYFDVVQEGIRTAAEWSWRRSVEAHFRLFTNVLEVARTAAESRNNS